MSFADDSSPVDTFPDNDDNALVAHLRGITARGSDPRGRVTVELDATGRLAEVEITSTAMDGNKGSLERAFREAHDAAYEALDQARRDQAPALAAAARAQVGDLVAEARTLQASAEAQLDKAVAAIAAAAARATGGAA